MSQVLEFVQTILMSEAGQTIVLAVVGLVVSVVLKTKFAQKYQLERCMLALQSGVQETYEAYIKEIKKSKEDGKLTEEEKMHARELAYKMAKDILAEEGIDIAKYYGPRIAKAIIEKLVQRSKTAGKVAKGVLPFSAGPELPL